MKILFHLPRGTLRKCFRDEDLNRLGKNHELILPDHDDASSLLGAFHQFAPNADTIITGWGTPALTDGMLDGTPGLRLLVHSAGSLRRLIPNSIWKRAIRVASANEALAIGVAETTLGMIIAGLKGFIPCRDWTRGGNWRGAYVLPNAIPIREMFGVTIGIISASKVGLHLIRLLRNFEVKVLLWDPFFSRDAAPAIGADWVELDELIRQSDVVSLHAPLLPETRHLMRREHFRAMKNNAIFINTARGAIVDEAALVEELETGRVFAFIDVTDPEPPAADHPFRKLSNVVLTPHTAGAVGNGCFRQGGSVVDQILEFCAGQPMHGEITADMFPRMA